jgi:hypothetical protein
MEFFCEYGTVLAVTIDKKGKEKGKGSPTNGFLTFATEQGAQTALEAGKGRDGTSAICQRLSSHLSPKIQLSISKADGKTDKRLLEAHQQRLARYKRQQLHLMNRLMDPDGSGFVDREEFIGFIQLTERHLKDRAGGLLSREHEREMEKIFKDQQEQERHERKKTEMSKEQEKGIQKGHDGSSADWDWKRRDDDFKKWWKATRNASQNSTVGKDCLSMKHHFIPFWVSDAITDTQRAAVVNRCKWGEAVNCGSDLWDTMDTNDNAHMTVADCRKVVGKLVGVDGHVYRKLSQAEIVQGKPRSHRVDTAIQRIMNQQRVLKFTSSTIVRKSAFLKYWASQHWLVKEYTLKNLYLEKIWNKLGTSRSGLQPWQAKALLAECWGEKGFNKEERQDFDNRFIEWWVDRDRDQSGQVAMGELSVWWVHQPMEILRRAETLDWNKAELRFDPNTIFDDLHDASVDNQDKRDQQYESALETLDKETRKADSDARAEKRVSIVSRLVRQSKWNSKLKNDETPFGMLTGAVRPPMVRTRISNLLNLKDRLEMESMFGGRGFVSKAMNPLATREEKKQIFQTQAATAVTTRDKFGGITEQHTAKGGTMEVGEMLRHYRLNRSRLNRCKERSRQIARALATYFNHTLFNYTLSSIKRKFGHGIHQIMELMKWVILMNLLLSCIWMCTVVVPRDWHNRRGDGIWNLTYTVLKGVVSDEGKHDASSLFYDGYAKHPVQWLWIELRLDLLYFIAVILNILVSIYLIRRRLASVTQGAGMSSSVGFKVHDDDNDSVAILGSYDFSVLGEEGEMAMRQEIRTKLDTWLRSHEEEVEEQRVNSTVVLKYLHRCRGTTGKLLTLTLLCFHVYALARLLRAKQSLSELGLGLLSPLAISILNSAVPRIIKMIVLAENHVHHLNEFSALDSGRDDNGSRAAASDA